MHAEQSSILKPVISPQRALAEVIQNTARMGVAGSKEIRHLGWLAGKVGVGVHVYVRETESVKCFIISSCRMHKCASMCVSDTNAISHIFNGSLFSYYHFVTMMCRCICANLLLFCPCEVQSFMPWKCGHYSLHPWGCTHLHVHCASFKCASLPHNLVCNVRKVWVKSIRCQFKYLNNTSAEALICCFVRHSYVASKCCTHAAKASLSLLHTHLCKHTHKHARTSIPV